MKKLLSLIICAVAVMSLITSCGSGSVAAPGDAEGWHAAWGAAIQPAGDDQMPYEFSLKENTCRQIITPTISGGKLRLRLSNQHGSIPLIIESVHIAKAESLGSSRIDVSTDTAVTFGGEAEITIDTGLTAESDEIAFEATALEPLAVTIKFGKFVGSTPSCHATANTTCWIAQGDCVSDEVMPSGQTMSCFYYLAGLDVWAEAGKEVIVCLGDSITDGVGASMDKNAAWPDKLAEHLNGEAAVINMGISGDNITGEWGIRSRLDRDVIDLPGVTYCMLMIGINDIGGSQEDITEKITADYKEVVERCHEKGIKVYVCTMTPIKGSGYYSELHEKIRAACNDFIKSSKGGFDGFIDMSAAVEREDDPTQMKDEYNCPWGDFLHPGDAGYEVMGKLAYDKFTEFTGKQENK